MLCLPSALSIAYPGFAAADEDPDLPPDESEPTDIIVTEGGDSGIGEDSPDGTTCGYSSNAWKYSTSVLSFNVDVFRHSVRTWACENDANITSIYNEYNECERIGPHGLLYTTSVSTNSGGVGTKSAWRRSTCRVNVGGTIDAGPISVDFQYSKQSNAKATFTMNGSGATVAWSHTTTTP